MGWDRKRSTGSKRRSSLEVKSWIVSLVKCCTINRWEAIRMVYADMAD